MTPRRAGHAADPDVFTNSAALNLHSFYFGLERIFEIIAVQIDGSKLECGHRHAELLRQMALDLPGICPAVLSRKSAEQLDELRCFGHHMRNIHAANLAPQRMRAVVETLPDLWHDVRQQMEAFAAYLDAMSRADESVAAC